MLRLFKIKINNEVFEVEVEEVGQGQPRVSRAPVQVPASAPKVSVSRPAPVAAPVTKPAAPAAPAAAAKEDSGSGDVIRAPIPGVVSEIRVSSGKSVKKGEVLMLLEAMKMQNEILAPRDAVVSEVAVSQGASVQTGDVLFRL